MSVHYGRPSTFDGPHLWMNMPPPYVGGGGAGVSQQQQQQQQQQLYISQQQQQQSQHPHLHAYAAPQAYHPGFGAAPFYPSPADHYHAQQQQQQYSRHAFAAAPFGAAFGYDQFGMAPPPYRAHGGENGSCSSDRSQSRGRWPSAPSSTSQSYAGSTWETNELGGAGGIWRESNVRSGSAGSNRQVDHDHPSFDRPPHRASSVEVVAPQVQQQQHISTSVEQPQQQNGQVEYQLISNVSPVPPPPTVERSAVPLADLATEMVWEAIALGVAAEDARSPSMPARWANSLSTKAPSLFNEIDEPKEESNATSRRYSRSSPHTPELFGAIGDGRTSKVSRMSLDDGFASDESSPSSSAPGTPVDEPTVEATAARRQRLAGLGLGFGYGAMEGKGQYEEVRRDGFDSPVEAMRVQARKLVPQQTAPQTTSTSFPAEPTTAFRQFVKQVLTATLLAPEDLVLALYYISRIPSGSIIPPTQPEQGSGATAQASAIKAAPFKIVLGALILANKTLQDNSYRNETFAAVSGIPLKDVNDLEVFVFGALGFDVAVREDVWSPWLETVIERSRAGRGNTGHRSEVSMSLQRLVRATLRHASTPAPASPVVMALEAPSTPCNAASLISEVNLDASGPLESPLKFNRRNTRFAQESPSRRCFGGDKKKAAMFPVSHTRSFGDENRQRIKC